MDVSTDIEEVRITKREKAAINNSRTRSQKFRANQDYTKINKSVKKEIKKDKQICQTGDKERQTSLSGDTCR